jgi:hypothetical protein
MRCGRGCRPSPPPRTSARRLPACHFACVPAHALCPSLTALPCHLAPGLPGHLGGPARRRQGEGRTPAATQPLPPIAEPPLSTTEPPTTEPPLSTTRAIHTALDITPPTSHLPSNNIQSLPLSLSLAPRRRWCPCWTAKRRAGRRPSTPRPWRASGRRCRCGMLHAACCMACLHSRPSRPQGPIGGLMREQGTPQNPACCLQPSFSSPAAAPHSFRPLTHLLARLRR